MSSNNKNHPKNHVGLNKQTMLYCGRMCYTTLKNNTHTLLEKQFCLVMVNVEGLVGRRWKWGEGQTSILL